MKRQSSLFKTVNNTAYGGELLKTRKGRSKGRPLALNSSMHLILKSSYARGSWAFNLSQNKLKIHRVVEKFTKKYGVKVLSRAYVGNHLHFHIKLSNRHAYRAFIRAITAAIAMAITEASRWKPLSTMIEGRFWDHRPFTRIIQGFRDFINLKGYIEINQLQGCGLSKAQARYVLAKEWDRLHNSS